MMFANPEIPIDQVLQYGSFGLVVAIVLYDWIFSRPADKKERREERAEMTNSFTTALTYVTDENKLALDNAIKEFKLEAAECREERREVATVAANEREKDREQRHNLATQIQKLSDAVESKS